MSVARRVPSIRPPAPPLSPPPAMATEVSAISPRLVERASPPVPPPPPMACSSTPCALPPSVETRCRSPAAFAPVKKFTRPAPPPTPPSPPTAVAGRTTSMLKTLPPLPPPPPIDWATRPKE